VLAFTHYRYLNLFDSRLKQAQSNIRKTTYGLSIIGTSTAQQKLCVYIATKKNPVRCAKFFFVKALHMIHLHMTGLIHVLNCRHQSCPCAMVVFNFLHASYYLSIDRTTPRVYVQCSTAVLFALKL
jgi:hypothetical protein